MKKPVPVLAAVCLLATAAVVRADTVLTPVGDPVDGGCWNQKFQVRGGNFNEIQVEIVSGALESPGVKDFSSPGWSYVAGDKVEDVAYSGPANTDLTFDVTFGGSCSTPVEVSFQAYDRDTCVCNTDLCYSGCGSCSDWHYGSCPPCPHKVTGEPVPEPVSLVFFGTGLVGVVGYVTRRRNR